MLSFLWSFALTSPFVPAACERKAYAKLLSIFQCHQMSPLKALVVVKHNQACFKFKYNILRMQVCYIWMTHRTVAASACCSTHISFGVSIFVSIHIERDTRTLSLGWDGFFNSFYADLKFLYTPLLGNFRQFHIISCLLFDRMYMTTVMIASRINSTYFFN